MLSETLISNNTDGTGNHCYVKQAKHRKTKAISCVECEKVTLHMWRVQRYFLEAGNSSRGKVVERILGGF